MRGEVLERDAQGGDWWIVAAGAGEVGLVRAWAARRLVGFERADDVVLVVSELAANAVLHALADGQPSAIHLVRTRSCVEVRVSSPLRAGAVPQARRVEASAESGRGLWLVESVADAWGVDTAGGCVAVWARFTAGEGA